MSDAYESIKALGRTARGLRGFSKAYAAAISAPGVDKHEAGFCKDSRFSVFRADITFDALTGVYGQSSCGTFSNGIDSTLAGEVFREALNDLRDDIFERMATRLEERQVKLLSQAKADAQRILDAVEEIEGAEPQP